MATQVVDTDGHIFEKDEIIYEYLEAPYRGKKELLAQPFFPASTACKNCRRSFRKPKTAAEDEYE
jgi:hypothetical protein